jgi:hypothetical protein
VRGNEERGGDLGHLIWGGSIWSADFVSGVLRVPFCAFVVLNEAGMGLGMCNYGSLIDTLFTDVEGVS